MLKAVKLLWKPPLQIFARKLSGGSSHNHVKTSSLFEQASENDWFILDVTTDILLETRHGATGKSQEDYLNYVKGVGFYFATPTEKETSVPTPLTEKQMQMIIGFNDIS